MFKCCREVARWLRKGVVRKGGRNGRGGGGRMAFSSVEEDSWLVGSCVSLCLIQHPQKSTTLCAWEEVSKKVPLRVFEVEVAPGSTSV